MLYKAIFNFHSEDKILKCDHSCKHYKAAYCDALQPTFNLNSSVDTEEANWKNVAWYNKSRFPHENSNNLRFYWINEKFWHE